MSKKNQRRSEKQEKRTETRKGKRRGVGTYSPSEKGEFGRAVFAFVAPVVRDPHHHRLLQGRHLAAQLSNKRRGESTSSKKDNRPRREHTSMADLMISSFLKRRAKFTSS
jgi:hypothetical protein